MKVALLAHGYPDELAGGTEKHVQALARDLTRAGHDVLVIAGTLARARGRQVEVTPGEDRAGGRVFPVLRVRRPDLYFDHWQKTRHPGVARAVEELLARAAPDVAHVHHWIRLTRDLVATCARAGVPAVVSLHDAWTGCPLAFRVRPDTREPCHRPVSPAACVPCAGLVPPHTPWLSEFEAGERVLARQADVDVELSLARAIVAPSAAHVAIQRAFGALGKRPVTLVPPWREHRLPRRPPRERARGEPLVLASWGRLAPHKGADVLLEALRVLPDECAVELELAGAADRPGIERDLRLRARGLGLCVRFHGAYDAARLHEHPAARAHAWVATTRALESWSLALDEALELGLPCVLPDDALHRERAGAWALHYEQGNARSLARALERLAGETGLLAAMRAALPAPEELARRAVEGRERVLALYAEAVAAGPPPPPPVVDEAAELAFLEAWDARIAAAPATETWCGEEGEG